MTTPAYGKPSDQPFTWLCRNGEEITVPSATKLDPEIDAIEAYEADPTKLSSTLRLFRSSLDEPTAKVLGLMRASEFNEFVTAWGEHSGVRLGESFLS